jgi:hypothetical protein
MDLMLNALDRRTVPILYTLLLPDAYVSGERINVLLRCCVLIQEGFKLMQILVVYIVKARQSCPCA